MLMNKVILLSFLSIILCTLIDISSCRTTGIGPGVQFGIRSDAIVTKWPEIESAASEGKEPGWMRRQLIRFGEVTSRIGNAMGAHATKITSAIDKVCEVVKTVIPLLAAVCHVGQFKFCAATNDAPDQLAAALSPTTLNLDEPDK